MKPVLYNIVLGICLCSCSGTGLTGYDFKTDARYSAVRMGVVVDLKATGHVNAGEDIGSGTAEGLFIIVSTADTIFFTADSEKLTRIVFGNQEKPVSDSTNFVNCFIPIMLEAGDSIYDPDEMAEIEKVIKASACGPKATYMKGQTAFLVVDKTEFERK